MNLLRNSKPGLLRFILVIPVIRKILRIKLFNLPYRLRGRVRGEKDNLIFKLFLFPSYEEAHNLLIKRESGFQSVVVFSSIMKSTH